MWSKSPLLVLRVRAKGFRIAVILAGYAVSGALLSWVPLLELLPGHWGEKARSALYSILQIVRAFLDSEPQEFVRVETKAGESDVLVDVRTLGFPPERRL